MSTAEKYYNEGKKLYDKREYKEAINNYTKVIELNPNYAEAYYNRGKCYKELERYEEAIKNFMEAIKLEPYNSNNAFVCINMGDCHLELERYEKAIASYKSALNFTNNEELIDIIKKLEACARKAKNLEREKELGENLVESLNNLKLGLENDETCISKNDYYQKLEKFQGALTDFSKELNLADFENFNAIENLSEVSQITNKALLLMKVETLIENKNDEMLETYKKELSELSEPELCLLKAEVYLKNGNRKEAFPNFLIACISDKSKYEETKAIIHKRVVDTNLALELEKSFANELESINDLALSTKEKIEYCKTKYLKNNLGKEITISADVISNIYTDSKTGRKLDL